MSRDMLSYERGEMQRYGLSKARLRLLLLKFIQNRSLRRADGAIFLTRYAAAVIQRSTGSLPCVAVVPHGVGDEFKRAQSVRPWPQRGGPINCLYVSNAAPYKHQWVVVQAISQLRRRGHDVRLTLAGGGSGPAQRRLDEEIRRSDPGREFVDCVGFVSPQDLPATLARADIFVFASSCENMPNTLLEGMAVGLPIACSNRGPMPEVLQDGGVYFDPENADSIAAAMERLLSDPVLREACASRARALADQYSWARCGRETWEFLASFSKRGP
jgi:glycosyltransferase involved in cell wall biosynthesis